MLKQPRRRQKNENRQNKSSRKKQNTNNKIVELNPTISTIILNANGQKIQIKRQRSSEWLFKKI